MNYKDLMQQIRHWDNQTSKWFMRHFYFLFFQIVLVAIFFFWFMNLISVIDTIFSPQEKTPLEKILMTQSLNMTIGVFLMLLNSFWFLFTFNSIQRIRSVLRDIAYHISRLRFNNKK